VAVVDEMSRLETCKRFLW